MSCGYELLSVQLRLTDARHSGNRLALALESIPDDAAVANLSYTVCYLLIGRSSYIYQLAVGTSFAKADRGLWYSMLDIIRPYTPALQSRARHKNYTSSKEFDMDMAKLFEKARKWHEPTSEPYGRILLLQASQVTR